MNSNISSKLSDMIKSGELTPRSPSNSSQLMSSGQLSPSRTQYLTSSSRMNGASATSKAADLLKTPSSPTRMTSASQLPKTPSSPTRMTVASELPRTPSPSKASRLSSMIAPSSPSRMTGPSAASKAAELSKSVYLTPASQVPRTPSPSIPSPSKLSRTPSSPSRMTGASQVPRTPSPSKASRLSSMVAPSSPSRMTGPSAASKAAELSKSVYLTPASQVPRTPSPSVPSPSKSLRLSSKIPISDKSASTLGVNVKRISQRTATPYPSQQLSVSSESSVSRPLSPSILSTRKSISRYNVKDMLEEIPDVLSPTRSISVKPSSKRGVLSGFITIEEDPQNDLPGTKVSLMISLQRDSIPVNTIDMKLADNGDVIYFSIGDLQSFLENFPQLSRGINQKVMNIYNSWRNKVGPEWKRSPIIWERSLDEVDFQ
jgi:hypothetical protein